jgi:hypothetical protein
LSPKPGTFFEGALAQAIQLGSMRLQWSARRSDFVSLLISGVAATVAPLQVFLLAYIVLGPLHYLTEIAWLRRKGFYFDHGLFSPRIYGVLVVLLTVAGAADHVTHRGLSFWLIGLFLLLSLSVWIRNRYVLLALVGAIVAAKVLSPGPAFYLVVAFVPTLVHVFFFTWIFMLNGAMRSPERGPLRWLNPALMLLIPLALLRVPVHYPALGMSWIRMEELSFAGVHTGLAGSMHHTIDLGANLLADPWVAALFRIFAFAYLFHYLNWFGKTDLLGWHRIPARSWAVIGVLYAASLGLYLYDFTLGFLILNFFSLLHVLMEFPLDWRALRFVLTRGRVAVSAAS